VPFDDLLSCKKNLPSYKSREKEKESERDREGLRNRGETRMREREVKSITKIYD
jgi:hypothetical protein